MSNRHPTVYDKLLAFVQAQTATLCDIYVKEYQANGPGLVFIYFDEVSGQAKVCYLSIDQLDEPILSDYKGRVETNTSDIIYFFVQAPEQSSFIELDTVGMGL
jgi:hypothetical protein